MAPVAVQVLLETQVKINLARVNLVVVTSLVQEHSLDKLLKQLVDSHTEWLQLEVVFLVLLKLQLRHQVSLEREVWEVVLDQCHLGLHLNLEVLDQGLCQVVILTPTLTLILPK